MIGKTISHYRIVDKLGEGGMGSVWKAEDTTLHRLVAIKALSKQLAENEEARARFVREAQAASALNHANITTVYELLEDEGEQFIAMEYVEGKTARDMVESGRVGVKKAVNVIMQVAEALGAAHRKGILHRDIKSANIMVSMEGNVKVMDFGLAHLEERSQLTRTGTTMGTLAYSSPEQLTGRPYDKRSEIWSLGVVFYELLTGQLPFRSSSEGELVFSIINNEQEPVSSLRGETQPAVETILNRMLEKNPTARFASCQELSTALQEIRPLLETTRAPEVAAPRQTAKTSVKRRALVLALPIVAIILALLLVPRPNRLEGPSLIVEEFEELTPGAVDWFSLGVVDEIRRILRASECLAGTPDRWDSYWKQLPHPYRAVRRKLRASHILSATVRRESHSDSTGVIRITPLITDTGDGRESDLRPLNIEFGPHTSIRSQIDVAEEIVQSLEALFPSLQRSRQHYVTESNEAYQWYSKSFEHGGRWWKPAAEMLEKAVEIDPGFALAWAQLAWVRAHGNLNLEFESTDRAKFAADRALELAPDLAEAHLAQGYYALWCLFDYEQAAVHFQVAREKDPNNVRAVSYYAVSRRYQGLWKEAIENIYQAIEMSPYTTNELMLGMEILDPYRRYRDAEALHPRIMELSPEWIQVHRWHAVRNLLWKARRNHLERLVEKWPDSVYQEFIANGGFNPSVRMLYRVLASHIAGDLEHLGETEHPSSTNYFLGRMEVSLALDHRGQAEAWADSFIVLAESQPLHWHWMPRTEQISERGLAYAVMGDKTEALRLGNTAVEEADQYTDAYRWSERRIDLAEIMTLVGDYEDAIDLLGEILDNPAYLSAAVLEVDPIWEPLREHPRFLEIFREHR